MRQDRHEPYQQNTNAVLRLSQNAGRTGGTMTAPLHRGTVTQIHGTHIFIANEQYPTIYAHRDQLTFSGPYIGLEVEFELVIRPRMRSAEAADVRPVVG